MKKKPSLAKRQADPRSKYWCNKADKLWSTLVRAAAGNVCEICHQPHKMLNAHHLIPREIKVLRHELWNGIALCPVCHKWSLKNSAHKSPMLFSIWIMRHKPETWQMLVNASSNIEASYDANAAELYNFHTAYDRLLQTPQ